MENLWSLRSGIDGQPCNVWGSRTLSHVRTHTQTDCRAGLKGCPLMFMKVTSNFSSSLQTVQSPVAVLTLRQPN
ncbi:hypothetical protein AOLI_G00060800 [Acnodon oligacanthus]